MLHMVQGIDDADEEARVQGTVQLLMDCIADLVETEGLDVLPAMTQVHADRDSSLTLHTCGPLTCTLTLTTVAHTSSMGLCVFVFVPPTNSHKRYKGKILH